MITAKEIISKLEEALRQFGEYSYYDKGPHEVMDTEAIAIELMSMPAKTAGEVLAGVGEHQHGEELARSLLSNMDGVDDAWFYECFETSGVEDVF